MRGGLGAVAAVFQLTIRIHLHLPQIDALADVSVAGQYAGGRAQAHKVPGQVALADLVLVGDQVGLARLVIKEQALGADDVPVRLVLFAAQEGPISGERIVLGHIDARTDGESLGIDQGIAHRNEDLRRVDLTREAHPVPGNASAVLQDARVAGETELLVGCQEQYVPEEVEGRAELESFILCHPAPCIGLIGGVHVDVVHVDREDLPGLILVVVRAGTAILLARSDVHGGIMNGVVLVHEVGGDRGVGQRVHLRVPPDAHHHAVRSDQRVGDTDVLDLIGRDQVLLQVIPGLGGHEPERVLIGVDTDEIAAGKL